MFSGYVKSGPKTQRLLNHVLPVKLLSSCLFIQIKLSILEINLDFEAEKVAKFSAFSWISLDKQCRRMNASKFSPVK